MLVGPVLILLVLFVIGPIGLFIGGGVWSALHGQVESEDADRRAEAQAP